MDERIGEHLKILNQYLLYLRTLTEADQNTFCNDFRIRGSAERYLQLAIESCINVSNRILSIIVLKQVDWDIERDICEICFYLGLKYDVVISPNSLPLDGGGLGWGC
ncbi:MAG: DUF86 domain-containing protein [Deltaproteobacteria bacterium]|nr:DUF86 domain-containing protein [Deltaproteobacteria bacterium]